MKNLHSAIYALYPEVVVIRGEEAFDKDGNKVKTNETSVAIKVAELQAQDIAEKQAAEAAKQSGAAKLAAIGLTPDEIKHLLGV